MGLLSGRREFIHARRVCVAPAASFVSVARARAQSIGDFCSGLWRQFALSDSNSGAATANNSQANNYIWLPERRLLAACVPAAISAAPASKRAGQHYLATFMSWRPTGARRVRRSASRPQRRPAQRRPSSQRSAQLMMMGADARAARDVSDAHPLSFMSDPRARSLLAARRATTTAAPHMQTAGRTRRARHLAGWLDGAECGRRLLNIIELDSGAARREHTDCRREALHNRRATDGREAAPTFPAKRVYLRRRQPAPPA